MGSIPGSGQSPRVEPGNPLQYSCLENPMDRGAWRVILLRSQSQTRLKQLSMHTLKSFCSVANKRLSKKMGPLSASEAYPHVLLKNDSFLPYHKIYVCCRKCRNAPKENRTHLRNLLPRKVSLSFLFLSPSPLPQVCTVSTTLFF